MNSMKFDKVERKKTVSFFLIIFSISLMIGSFFYNINSASYLKNSQQLNQNKLQTAQVNATGWIDLWGIKDKYIHEKGTDIYIDNWDNIYVVGMQQYLQNDTSSLSFLKYNSTKYPYN